MGKLTSVTTTTTVELVYKLSKPLTIQLEFTKYVYDSIVIHLKDLETINGKPSLPTVFAYVNITVDQDTYRLYKSISIPVGFNLLMRNIRKYSVYEYQSILNCVSEQYYILTKQRFDPSKIDESGNIIIPLPET